MLYDFFVSLLEGWAYEGSADIAHLFTFISLCLILYSVVLFVIWLFKSSLNLLGFFGGGDFFD